MMLPVRWTGRERGSQRIAPKASTFCITRPHGPFRSRQLAPKRPDNSTRLSQNSQRHYADEVSVSVISPSPQPRLGRTPSLNG